MLLPHPVGCSLVADLERGLADVALLLIDGVGLPRRGTGIHCRSGLARPHPVSRQGYDSPIVPLRALLHWFERFVIDVMLLVPPIAKLQRLFGPLLRCLLLCYWGCDVADLS